MSSIQSKLPEGSAARRLTILFLGSISLLGLTSLALFIGGAASPLLIADPGAFVRWGLPLVTAIAQVSMAVAVGSLALAAYALGDRTKQLATALTIAAVAATVWAVAQITQALFTYLSVTGTGISGDPKFGAQFLMFLTQIELGRYLLLNAAGAVIVSVMAVSVRSLTGTIFTATVAILSLVPIALTGHASGTANHGIAVNALGLHLLAVSLWVGGLITLALLRTRHELSLLVIKRYSALALVAFALITTSGVISAWLRVGSISALFGPYGALLAIKAGILVVLGVFGAYYRARLFKRWVSGKAFWRLVLVEAVLMTGAIGVAAALSRTAPPVNAANLVGITPAEILTGQKLPPELTFDTFLSQWRMDPLWLAICALGILGYLIGVARLKKRGDKWAISRTLSWIAGMLLLAFITNGSFNAYEEYLFSVHMMAHMLLTMAVPIFLVPGAPITLISRATEKRHDDSRGLREWVLWAVHTKYAQFISNPIIAGLLFATSLVVFYYTPIFGWATREHIGHEWMIIHFVISGYLFVQALIGIDPGPHRLPYAMRIGLLILVLAFHAFFGLAVMTGNGLLLADWFGAMGRTWGAAPLEDQHIGGGIAWGIGEMPTAALTIIVSVQWYRSDAREARRLDRAADRGDNKDLEQYNAMLAKLAARDAIDGGK
ncbi:MAG: cytochrome c oxidase assembly protein [Micrococcales bacterium]